MFGEAVTFVAVGATMAVKKLWNSAEEDREDLVEVITEGEVRFCFTKGNTDFTVVLKKAAASKFNFSQFCSKI